MGINTILKNTIASGNLTIGVTSRLAHSLNVNGTAVIPQFVQADREGFTVTADITFINVTRTAAAGSANCNVFCEYYHTIEDVVPSTGLTQFLGSGSGAATSPSMSVSALITGTATILTPGEIAQVNTGGAVTVTLPKASTCGGTMIIVKDATGTANTHNITVDPNAVNPDTIDGGATATVTVNNGGLILVSDGVSNWLIAAVYSATH